MQLFNQMKLNIVDIVKMFLNWILIGQSRDKNGVTIYVETVRINLKEAPYLRKRK